MFFGGKFYSKLRQSSKGIQFGTEVRTGIDLKTRATSGGGGLIGRNPGYVDINWDLNSEIGIPDEVYILKSNDAGNTKVYSYTGNTENKSLIANSGFVKLDLNSVYPPFSIIKRYIDNEALTTSVNFDEGWSVPNNITLVRSTLATPPQECTVEYRFTDSNFIEGLGGHSQNNFANVNENSIQDIFDMKEFPYIEQLALTECPMTEFRNPPLRLKLLDVGEYRDGSVTCTRFDPLPETMQGLKWNYVPGQSENLGTILSNCSNMRSLFMTNFSGWPVVRANANAELPSTFDISHMNLLEELNISCNTGGDTIIWPSSLPANKLQFFDLDDPNVSDTTSLESFLSNQLDSIRLFGISNCNSLPTVTLNFGNTTTSSMNKVYIVNTDVAGTIDYSTVNSELDYFSVQNNASYPIVNFSGCTNIGILSLRNCGLTDIELPSASPLEILELENNAIDLVNVNTNFYTQLSSFAATLDTLNFNKNSNVFQELGTTLDLSLFAALRNIDLSNNSLVTITLPSTAGTFDNIEFINTSTNPMSNFTTLNNFTTHANILQRLDCRYTPNVSYDLSTFTTLTSAVVLDDVGNTTIDISSTNNTNVNQIVIRENQNLTTVILASISISSNNITIQDNPNLITINNLDKIYASYTTRGINLSDNVIYNESLPVGLQNLGTQFRSWVAAGCALDQTSVDTTIDNAYQNRSKFVSDGIINPILTINGGTTVTPSGTYQAPSGFILGSADGTPADALEKAYVLVENYGWQITYNI